MATTEADLLELEAQAARIRTGPKGTVGWTLRKLRSTPFVRRVEWTQTEESVRTVLGAILGLISFIVGLIVLRALVPWFGHLIRSVLADWLGHWRMNHRLYSDFRKLLHAVFWIALIWVVWLIALAVYQKVRSLPVSKKLTKWLAFLLLVALATMAIPLTAASASVKPIVCAAGTVSRPHVQAKSQKDCIVRKATVTTSATTPKPKAKPPVLPYLSKADQAAICKALFNPMGWKCNQLKMAQNVNFNNNPQERGAAAFSKHTLMTRSDIAAFLGGSSKDSVLARSRIKKALAAYPGEYQRALKGQGFVPIQFSLEAQYFGTTYVSNNLVLNETGARQVGPNDILWLFITQKQVIVPGASIRADCGNPHFTAIVPVHPGTPNAPPIQTPPNLKDCAKHDPNAQDDSVTCGSKLSGKEQQPVQEHKQPPTKGFTGGVIQLVGSPDPAKTIPPTPTGTDSGCASCAPKGGNTTTGQVGSTDGSSGGTNGSDQGTEGSNQTSTGTVPPPP